MNKEICISTVTIMGSFQKRQMLYREYTEALRKEGSISPNTFLEISDVSKKRVEELQQLKKGLSSLEGIIPQDTYKSLLSSIENEEALASMLVSDSENFLETQDKKFEESVLARLEYETEYSINLNQSLATVERQMGIIMVGAVLNNKFSVEEIKEIANTLENGSPFQKQMEDLANYMERTNLYGKKEVASVQNESAKTNPESQPQPVDDKKEEVKKEPTLADKISQINYSSDRNIVAEVQELTVEDRMAQIAASLVLLSDKEKLSLADMIQIHTLQEEQVKLEGYVASLSNQKLSRKEVKRNKKMEVATAKIEENKRLIAQSMENSKQYNSKIMRFFSARYQEKLAEQVLNLRDKRGILQREQKMSAIAKYNKNSGRIVRSSRILGTIKGMNEFKNVKLEELRTLREQVVTEFQNLQQDIGRFTRERGMVTQLQNSQVVAPDRIISLDEYRKSKERALAS